MKSITTPLLLATLLLAACKKETASTAYQPTSKTNPALRAFSYKASKAMITQSYSQMLPVDTFYIDSDQQQPNITLQHNEQKYYFWASSLFIDAEDKICVVYISDDPIPKGNYKTQSSNININTNAEQGFVKIIVRNSMPQPWTAFDVEAGTMRKEILELICRNQSDFYAYIKLHILDCVTAAMEAETLVDTDPAQAQDICNAVLADIHYIASTISTYAAKKEAEPYHHELQALQFKFNTLYTRLLQKNQIAKDTKSRVTETILHLSEFQIYATLDGYAPQLLANNYNDWFKTRHKASANAAAIGIYDRLWRKALIEELKF